MLTEQFELAKDDIEMLPDKFPSVDFLRADKADALLASGDLQECKSYVRLTYGLEMKKHTALRLYLDNVFANLFLGTLILLLGTSPFFRIGASKSLNMTIHF